MDFQSLLGQFFHSQTMLGTWRGASPAKNPHLYYLLSLAFYFGKQEKTQAVWKKAKTRGTSLPFGFQVSQELTSLLSQVLKLIRPIRPQVL